jgi:hypothetical protein
MNKSMKQLIKDAEEQGFEALVLKSGHVVFLLGGVRITTFAGTPSDHRSWKNSMAYMKRAWFVPRGKHGR